MEQTTLVQLSESEMGEVSGGSWQCWLGGAALVGSFYLMNPLMVAASVGYLIDNGCFC
jgi:hypothetical protein